MGNKYNYIIIVTLSLIVFGNTFFNGYNLDDHLVTKNIPVSIEEIFTSSSLNENGFSYGYRPVSILSFFLEYKVFGENPQISHLVNLVLYVLLSCLFFKLLKSMFDEVSEYILLFIALLFVVHPIHSEVVASIKNRDEILSLLFMVFASLFVFKWLQQKSIGALILVFVGCSLAILSKKSSLPIFLLIPLMVILQNKVSLKNVLLIGVVTGVPLSLFVFNFNIFNGLILFGSFLFILLSFFGIKKAIENERLALPSTEFMLGSLIGVFLVTVGIWNENIYFILGAFLGSIFIAFSNQRLFFIVVLMLSIIGFIISYELQFIRFSIVLISFSLIIFGGNRKRFWIDLVLLIVHIGIFGAFKTNPISITYILPLIIFLSSRVNRLLPFILSLVVVGISIQASSFGPFQISLLLLSSLFVAQSNMKAISRPILALLVVCFVGGLGLKFHQIEKNVRAEKQENSFTKEDVPLEVGRKLEFIENTLVAVDYEYQRIPTGALVLGEYLRLMVFPSELSFYYGYSKVNTTNFSDYRVWLSLLIHMSLLYLALRFFKSRPMISVGIFWYLACIFIFSNIPVLVAGMVGERLAFCASLGFCIAIGGVIQWIKPNYDFRKPKGVELVTIAILVVLSTRAFARNIDWKSPSTLMSHDIEHLKNSAQANYLLAVHTIKQAEANGVDLKEVQNSILYFKRAIEIYPQHYNFHIDLGKAYLVQGKQRLAKQSFLDANKLQENAIYGLFELTKVCFGLKEYNKVIEYGELYLKQDELNPVVFELVSYSYFLSGMETEARRVAREGLQKFPMNQNLNDLIQHTQN